MAIHHRTPREMFHEMNVIKDRLRDGAEPIDDDKPSAAARRMARKRKLAENDNPWTARLPEINAALHPSGYAMIETSRSHFGDLMIRRGGRLIHLARSEAALTLAEIVAKIGGER